jgi:23S rRNA (cytidine2498-2'-O)-methyltransferase
MTRALLACAPSFSEMALRELRRLRPEAQPLAEIGPGLWLVRFPGPYEELGQQWAERPPIYAHHLCPVQAQVSLAREQRPGGELHRLYEALRGRLLPRIQRRLSFTVQVRVLGALACSPLALEAEITEAVRAGTGARWHPERAEQVVSVVLGDREGIPTALLGASLASHNLSPWNGGVPRFPVDPGQLNRAEPKLREALEVFRLRFPPGARALDLGAAPGGWSRVLRQQGLVVTAVNPRPLHPTLLADPGLRYHAKAAEEYLQQELEIFDLITNDMRLDPRDTARLMVAFAPRLRPGGTAVVTLKLRQEDRLKLMDHAFRLLRRAYTIKRVRHLYFNRSEVTLWLRRR